VVGCPRLKVRGSRALRLASRPCALRPWNIIRRSCALRPALRLARRWRRVGNKKPPTRGPRAGGRAPRQEGAAGNSSVLLWQWTWQERTLYRACMRCTGRGGQPLWTRDKALRFACPIVLDPRLRETCAALLSSVQKLASNCLPIALQYLVAIPIDDCTR
jgi:hypothetical protein